MSGSVAAGVAATGLMTRLTPEARRLRRSVLEWLETMRVGGEVGQYRMNAGADATVFSSCFAIFIRHLWDDLEGAPLHERTHWLSYIQSFQDPVTGLFVDPENAERAPDPTHDTEHLNQQLTTFCLGAVHALGGRPLHPLRLPLAWTDPDHLQSWLASLDWRNPWNSGNKAMFSAILLAYKARHDGDRRARSALEVWFDWHDRHQNESGFWGIGYRARYLDGLGGAYHQLTMYHYTGRPIRRHQAIVDRALMLQQPDGLFSPYLGGAACYELDAVDVLVHQYSCHDYRRADIRGALRRVLDAVLENQNADGGFCWAHRRDWTWTDFLWLAADIGRHRSLRYWYLCWRAAAVVQLRRDPRIKTGWTRQSRRWSDSSIFDTWFRCLTIAEISHVLTDTPFSSARWRFLEVPGLGWFPPVP